MACTSTEFFGFQSTKANKKRKFSYLSPRWRIANPVAIIVKIISHASRGGNFIRQTVSFVVIDPISGIKVIWTIVEVIRTVIEVVGAIVKVIRAIFKVVGRSAKGHGLSYS